jgi:hypothetical protein
MTNSNPGALKNSKGILESIAALRPVVGKKRKRGGEIDDLYQVDAY